MWQSTFSKITTKVLDEMESKLCFEHIKVTPANSERCKQWFMEKCKIPGVIGCVNGTHIGLQRPCENEHIFFNRKGYHNLNAMIVSQILYTVPFLNVHNYISYVRMRLCMLSFICDHEHFINAVNARRSRFLCMETF